MKKIYRIIIAAVFVCLCCAPAMASYTPTTANVTTGTSSSDGKILGTVACDGSSTCTVTWALNSWFDQADSACVNFIFVHDNETSITTTFEWSRDGGTTWTEYKPPSPVNSKPTGVTIIYNAVSETWDHCLQLPRKIDMLRAKTVYSGGSPKAKVEQNLYLEK